jgi:hypothetical protein
VTDEVHGSRERGGSAAAAQLDPQLPKLRVVDGRGRARERVRAGGGLRERDHVTDRVRTHQALHEAIHPVGDSPVRRRPVAQRLQQKPEALLSLGRPDPDDLEHPLLELAIRDSDRAAAELLPVPDDVVGGGEGLVGALGVELPTVER